MLWKRLPYCPSKRLYQFTRPPRMFENKGFPSFLPTLNINLLKELYQFITFYSAVKKNHGREMNWFGSQTDMV